eukprot:4003231-Prymnesium_polylepis.1
MPLTHLSSTRVLEKGEGGKQMHMFTEWGYETKQNEQQKAKSLIFAKYGHRNFPMRETKNVSAPTRRAYDLLSAPLSGSKSRVERRVAPLSKLA